MVKKSNRGVKKTLKCLSSICSAPKGYKRSYGFQPPLDPLQVTQYIGQFFLVLDIIFLSLPLLPIYLLIPFCVVYLANIIVNLCVILIISFFDPSDPFLKSKKLQAVAPKNVRTKWCVYCQKFVDKTSKHCKLCDKCVLNFDHHCRWLNTCVGDTNYKVFFMFLSGVTFLLFLALLNKVVAAVWIPIFWTDYTANIFNLYWWIIPFWIHLPFSFFAFIVEAFVFNYVIRLWLFHIKLKFLGLTTYQHIMNQRKLKQKEKKEYKEVRSLKWDWNCLGLSKKEKQSNEMSGKVKSKVFKINKVVPYVNSNEEGNGDGDGKNEIEMNENEVLKYKSELKIEPNSEIEDIGVERKGESKSIEESNEKTSEIIEIGEIKKEKMIKKRSKRKFDILSKKYSNSNFMNNNKRKLKKVRSLSDLTNKFTNLQNCRSPSSKTGFKYDVNMLIEYKSNSTMELREYLSNNYKKSKTNLNNIKSIRKIKGLKESKSVDPIDVGCFEDRSSEAEIVEGDKV